MDSLERTDGEREIALYENISQNMETKCDTLTLVDVGIRTVPNLTAHEWLVMISLKRNKISSFDKNCFPAYLIKLVMSNNRIAKTLDETHIPSSLTTFIASNCKIETFDGSSLDNLRKLNLSNNLLDCIVYPRNLEYLNVNGNNLTELPICPVTLTQIYCDGNQIKKINDLSPNLTIFSGKTNFITEMPVFPDSTENINLSCNIISKIGHIPQNIVSFSMAGNSLNCSLTFPKSVIHVDLAGNMLTEFPVFEEGVKDINVSRNSIKQITSLPLTVKTLNCNENEGISILPEILARDTCDISVVSKIDLFDEYDNYGPDASTYETNNEMSFDTSYDNFEPDVSVFETFNKQNKQKYSKISDDFDKHHYTQNALVSRARSRKTPHKDIDPFNMLDFSNHIPKKYKSYLICISDKNKKIIIL